MGTLTAALQPLIVRAKTSKEAWDILALTYANPSRAHIMQLKEKFDSIKKSADQSISDYMNSIQVCVDQLALMGKILDPEDVIAKVLRGLDYETYKAVINPVRARDNPITFEALHEKLFQQELLIQHETNTTNNTNLFAPSANPSYRHNQQNSGQNRPYNPHVYNQQQPHHHHSNTAGPRPFKGRCQWCREIGHFVTVVIPKLKICQEHHPIFDKLKEVVTTLLNFTTMFSRAHEENLKQLEVEKKKEKYSENQRWEIEM
ncbi:uncharacterized protein LOC141608399 [Silene latifolia]|uniref:uncharacterized protein LOC141608399 n=1 Tax=Silene latifolia TaxID=37657 RepID=UPI003D77A142